MALYQGSNGRHQLRQGGAQRHKGQGNHGLRHTQRLGDQRPVVHQQICAHGNQRRTHDQKQSADTQGPLLRIGLIFHRGGGGIFHSLTDGAEQIQRQNHQHADADGIAKVAGKVGVQTVDRGSAEKENHG